MGAFTKPPALRAVPDFPILSAGTRITTRVIVSHDDRHSADTHSSLKHLSRMDQRSGGRPNADNLECDGLVPGIEHDHHEVLAGILLHNPTNESCHFPGTSNRRRNLSPRSSIPHHCLSNHRGFDHDVTCEGLT